MIAFILKENAIYAKATYDEKGDQDLSLTCTSKVSGDGFKSSAMQN